MNIAILTHDGTVECRPDTTWEREDRDIYAPDFVTGYTYSPVLFARVCKAGKCIGSKFTDRYYDAVNYGVLLYSVLEDVEEASGRSLTSSVMDHTSVLPFPLYDKAVLGNKDNMFSLEADEKNAAGKSMLFSTDCGSPEIIDSALQKVSSFLSLRIGDIVAAELNAPVPLISRESLDRIRLSGTFCGNSLFDFNIIM